MKYHKILFLIFSLTLFFSCTKEEVLSDETVHHFFLQNDQSIMPIVVKGNTNAKVFCIVLHGGPGDSGTEGFGYGDVFKTIESDFAMVYYDQRCAGLSQGNCHAKELEVSDFVADLDQLIVLLNDKYGDDISLFLLGHSWGATLGIDYLINGQYKADIKGMIQSDGSHNIPLLSIEQKKFLQHYGNQQIEFGNNTIKWQEILNIVESADILSIEGRLAILFETERALDLFTNVDSVKTSTLQSNRIIPVVANLFITTTNSSISSNLPFYEKLMAYDVSQELKSIQNPVALYWGRFDAIHPPAMAHDLFNKLGSTEKELHFFEQSHHSPMAQENQAYQSKVIEFINKYK